MLNKKNLLKIFYSSPTPSLILHPDSPHYTIIDANNSFCQVTKSDRNELIRRGVFEAFPVNPSDPSDKGATALAISLKRVIATREAHKMDIQKFDIPIRGTDRFEVKYWSPVNIPILDDLGEVEFILHTSQDVTEQTRSETEREYLMHVIEKSLNEIYITDSETMLFRYVNEAAIKNTGYTRKELLKMSPMEIIAENDLERVNRKIAPLKNEEREKAVFETCHKRADGSLYQVEVHLQRVENESAFLAIIVDITDRKKSEGEREQLIRELTRNNKDLRQFSYITSHNLRSPITNLESLVHILEHIPLDNENARKVMDDISITTQVLKNTVNDLTEILIIKDNPAIEHEMVCFSSVFDDVLKQSKYLLDKYDPEIITDFREAPSVLFNRTYLESIFLNLFTNAIKFRSPERHLVISVRTTDLESQVLLEFQDNGIGLDVEKYKERFFGLYQKFHSHTDSKGLGLYLVKSQVETLGGSIEASGEVDKGMCIRIYFMKSQQDEDTIYS